MTDSPERPYLIAGNWKMNGGVASNERLITGILSALPDNPSAEYLVCPPAVYLDSVASQIGSSALQLGAQDVSEYAAGAYTGEISAAMLAEFGCRYVLVGHSERRSLFGELNEQVAEKFSAAVEAGLRPILCVGETLAQRQAEETEAVVERQLTSVMDMVGVAGFAKAVVAYEPVWAIGTGQTATPEQAQAVHAFLRSCIAGLDKELGEATRIVYGGSMKAANAAGLLAMPDIDGGLIGGASLNAEEFMAIGKAAEAAH